MSTPPLHLYQVLEEEYERLHGKPAPSTQTPATSVQGPASSKTGAPAGQAKVNVADQETRLRNIIKDIHQAQHSAICLSGGGIRSATFGLGVLQGLAHHNVLEKFAYLSTVSGGGYVGGWLSAWIHRHPRGVQGVAAELPSDDPGLLLSPEPEPITHLRSYSNYLTPQLGLLSADTWTLIAITGRNLILNWLVIIPLLIAVLALPRLFVSVGQLSPASYLRWAALALAFACGAWMIAYVGIKRPSIAKKHCTPPEFLWFCLTPLLISATLLGWYQSWWSNAKDFETQANWCAACHPSIRYIAFGVLLHLAGWVIYSIWLLRFKGWKPWVELLVVIFNGTVGGLLLWLVATKTFLDLTAGDLIILGTFHIHRLLVYAALAVPIYLILVLLALTLFAGISSRWTEDEDREWWARFAGWVLIAVVVWALASLLVLVGPGLMTYFWAKYVMSAGGVVGLLTALAGRSAQSPAKKKQKQPNGLTTVLMSYALPLGAVAFCGVLVVFLSLVTNYLLDLLATFLTWIGPFLSLSMDWAYNQIFDFHGNQAMLNEAALTRVGSSVVFASSRQILILIGLIGGLGVVMAHLINTNKFSYHAMYRNRLIRAYLGASRQNFERTPDPFTGFDADDNLEMRDLAAQTPLHIVNITLNLVHGDRLAWQQRKAESFTVSPLHCGSFQIPDVEDRTQPAYGSYRRTSEYGGQISGGITLGTAVAISGAAVSPNMGYYSSPVVTFLMTLFNVRLGWWLGNPGPKGEDYYKFAYPKSAVYPIVAEGLGLTDDKSKYVYLSDGGHFENLGLYEMVLRRCGLIVISDGSADPDFQFDGLGNAVQKIRADFGIPIDFQPMEIFPRRDKKRGAYCAIGTIRYSCIDVWDSVDKDGNPVKVRARDGTIIYIKPVFYGDEPRDIYHYAMTHDTFPHESTADQWFSEAQFESYRKLGSYIVDIICKGVASGEISASDLTDEVLSKFLGQALDRAREFVMTKKTAATTEAESDELKSD